MTKEKDLEYIKGFSKIKVSTICKELNIDKSNIWSKKASAENIARVKEKIREELKKLEENE